MISEETAQGVKYMVGEKEVKWEKLIWDYLEF